MTMRITMIQSRLGESGSVLAAGTTNTVSDAFGAAMVGAGYATDTDRALTPGVSQYTPSTAAAVQSLVSTPWNLLPALVLGGDHPYAQWVGGMGPAYRDAGLKTFCAICTDTSIVGGTVAPTGAGEMASWRQVADLPAMGVEVVSHGSRHIQSWSRINTGMRIRYTGAAGAPTVAISSSALTLTGNGGGENAALAFSTYTTLAALAAQINSQGGGVWTATLADELTGLEQSGNLLVVAARNVTATANQQFAAGGGIVLRYTGRLYEQVYAFRDSSNRFNVICDGVRRLNFDLASGSYDTLAELVAGINAGGITGLTAALSDNRKTETATFQSYVVGDESSLNLKIAQAEIQTKRTTFDAGLPRWYMIERQLVRSRETAASYGLTLTHFAQPGDDFHQYLSDHTGFESFRGNPDVRFIAPYQQLMAAGDQRFSLMQTTADNSTIGWDLNRYKACIDALCDSPGFLVSLNTHKVLPDGTSGGRYSFPNGDAYGEMTEADFVPAVAYVGSKVASGALLNLGPSEMHRRRASCLMPKNLCFNTKFKNDGTTLLNQTDPGFKIPGWYLVTPNSVFSAVSVANDALVCTTTASTGTFFLQQELILQPGKTYLLSCTVEFTAYTSGNGIVLALQSPRGRFPGMVAPETTATILGQRQAGAAGNGTRMQRIDLVVTIPDSSAVRLPKVISNAGPFNLGSNPAQIALNIDAKASLTINVAGATPTATTADEVAAAINAAIAASASYPAEYRGAASVVNGKVVVQGPYTSLEERYDSGYGVSIDSGSTNSATTTVFGNSVVRAPGLVQMPSDATQWPWLLSLQSGVIGTFSISAPTVMELTGS
jgi:hypothetical protein